VDFGNCRRCSAYAYTYLYSYSYSYSDTYIYSDAETDPNTAAASHAAASALRLWNLSSRNLTECKSKIRCDGSGSDDLTDQINTSGVQNHGHNTANGTSAHRR